MRNRTESGLLISMLQNLDLFYLNGQVIFGVIDAKMDESVLEEKSC